MLSHFPELGARKDIVPVELGWHRYWEREAPAWSELVALASGT